jgi:two-component system, NarL family, response regulator NreC
VRPHAEIRAEKKIRCALVHDHVLLRQGLRRLLEDESDIEVVVEAGNAAEALQRVFLHRPEVVIADAHLFECEEDQAEGLILRESPQSRVLFLTAHDGGEPRLAETASYAVRQTSADELVEMVRKTAGSDPTASRDGRQMEDRRGDDWRSEELASRKRILTAREREVLKLLAEGRTVRSAAGVLGLSVKTVDAHKFNLMRKLGIHNKAELVMWAIQKRVVRVPASL